MSDTNNEVKFKRKKKNKSIMGYVYLFIFVFVLALSFLSYLVNSYSPDIDVEIGNKEDITLNEADMNMEIKSIDERLNWIQEEDEMPSVSIKENKLKNNEDKITDKPKEEVKKEEKVIPMPERPKVPKVEKPQPLDIRSELNVNTNTKPVIPAPIPSLTKVYLGNYTTIEEAMGIQQKVNADFPEAMPFVKSVNGKYIVQLASFSKKEVADAFVGRLQAKGYSPKVIYDN